MEDTASGDEQTHYRQPMEEKPVKKFLVKQLQWRSEFLDKKSKYLDRKSATARER